MSEIKLEDRLKMAHTIKFTSAMRRKVALEVSWFDVHGESHTQEFSVKEGSVIEF